MEFFQRRLVPIAGCWLLFVLSGAHEAAAQCVMGTPYQFEPPIDGYPTTNRFLPGFSDSFDLYRSGSSKRMIIRENYGFLVYDLEIPDRPSQVGYLDIESQPTYSKGGDGFSTVVTLSAAPDGSRALVNYKESPHGTLLMKPTNPSFTFAGEFAPTQTQGGTVVDSFVSPARYLGYALKSNVIPALTVADISTFVTGANANRPRSIPAETIANSPIGFGLIRAGHFLLYWTGTSIVVIDASEPGPNGSISSRFRITTLGAAAFGLPTDGRLYGVAAGIHPRDQSLYVLAKSTANDSTLNGYGLVRSVDGVSFTRVGPSYVPPLPWSGADASGGAVSMTPTATDLLVFAWGQQASTKKNKLFVWSASQWGTDLAPTAIIPASSDFYEAKVTQFQDTGSGLYGYVGAVGAAYAFALPCTPLPLPALSNLRVERRPCPAAAGCPLAEGATVFVGDSVAIFPSVDPPPVQQPLRDWRFDFDFHPGSTEDSGTSPRLLSSDRNFTSAEPSPPALFSLVGPCDPSTPAAANPSSGNGCWVSTLNNAAQGGPDFVSPTEGTARPLTLAFEATNDAGSLQTKTFVLNWTVPRTRLASTTINILDPLVDASDGSPLESGLIWQFGIDPKAPRGEVLTPDLGCTRRYCFHTFPRRGTYNYWVTVPYSAGYTSPDCAAPCTATKGTLVVNDPRVNYFSVTPCRLLDTRNLAAPSLDANSVRVLTGTGNCGIPATAQGLSANITTTGATASGSLTFFAGPGPTPKASSISFVPVRARANSSLVALNAQGQFSVACTMPGVGSGSADMIVDVSGYFE